MLVTICLLLAAGSQAFANPVYDLGDMVPHGLNNHGQVVGDSLDPVDDSAPPHAVVWSAGTLSRLVEPAGATQSNANGINAAGKIAGDFESNVNGLSVDALSWASITAQPHQIGPLGPDPQGGDLWPRQRRRHRR